jgi:hypothetical protein
VYRLTWRLPLAGLVAFRHLQFSQIRGRQPYLIVRKILYAIFSLSRERAGSGQLHPMSRSLQRLARLRCGNPSRHVCKWPLVFSIGPWNWPAARGRHALLRGQGRPHQHRPLLDRNHGFCRNPLAGTLLCAHSLGDRGSPPMRALSGIYDFSRERLGLLGLFDRSIPWSRMLIMCHPGRSASELRRIDSLTSQCDAELAFLLTMSGLGSWSRMNFSLAVCGRSAEIFLRTRGVAIPSARHRNSGRGRTRAFAGHLPRRNRRNDRAAAPAC